MRLNSTVEVDGFVVEGPTAGGHNAPARNKEVDDERQPIYGERDKPNLETIMKLGKPYWLAGSYAGRLKEAQDYGAAGVQVGSAFALSKESGLTEEAKRLMREKISRKELTVLTSVVASPTGFPIQLAQIEGTLTEENVYKERKRVCSLGYLVEARKNEDGKLEFLCPAEPEKAYVRKGGSMEDTKERVCLCNGLATAAGHGQIDEPKIFTLGKDLSPISKLMAENPDGYTAENVIGFVFAESTQVEN